MKEYIIDVLERHVELGRTSISCPSRRLPSSFRDVDMTYRLTIRCLNGYQSSPARCLRRDSMLSLQSCSAGRESSSYSRIQMVAIDFTDIEWYGEDPPFIVTCQSKNDTNRFIRFATVAVVEDGKTVPSEGTTGDTAVEHGGFHRGFHPVYPAAARHQGDTLRHQVLLEHCY